MRKAAHIRTSTVVLVSLVLILAATLVVSLFAIDKLTKNNLFAKSIFASGDYWLERSQSSISGDETPEESADRAARRVVELAFRTYPNRMVRTIPADAYGVYDYAAYVLPDEPVSEYADPFCGVIQATEKRGDTYVHVMYQLVADTVLYRTAAAHYLMYGVTPESTAELADLLRIGYDFNLDLAAEAKKVLDVPYLSQENILPNGCEAVAATMLLQYAGLDISPTDFTDRFLPCGEVKIRWGVRFGPNPKEAYAGDPYSKSAGFGCYAPVIVKALAAAAPDGFRPLDLSGKTLQELADTYIDAGIPVAVWVTVEMGEIEKMIQWQSEDGSQSFLYPANEHCMVLVGYDDTNYYFNDPDASRGLVAYPKAAASLAYNSLGRQAVALVKT